MNLSGADVTSSSRSSSSEPIRLSEYPAPLFARLQEQVVPLSALQKEILRLTQSSAQSSSQPSIQPSTGQEWVQHVNRPDYEGEWDVLPLRCARQHVDTHPILQAFAIEADEAWQDLPILANCPRIREILQNLDCPLKAVRLMRLRAGAEIRPHRDHGLSIEHGEARLHLPVFTSDKVSFTVGGCTVPMAAGELWYINADIEHAVYNDSHEDRIHLVIDCVANPWLRSVIEQGCRLVNTVTGIVSDADK